MKIIALSHSKLGQLNICPKMFYFQREEQLKGVPDDPDVFQLGRVVHKAIAHLTDNPIEENIDHCVDLALEEYEGKIPNQTMIAEVRDMIKDWYKPEKFFGEVLSKEMLTSICVKCGNRIKDWGTFCGNCGATFDGPGANFRFDFVIDLALKRGPKLLIRDYKTGGRRYSSKELKESGQLIAYAMCARALWPEFKQIDVEIDMVRYGIPIGDTVSYDEMQGFLRNTIAIRNGLLKVKKPGGFPGPHCVGCAGKLNGVCDEWKQYMKLQVKAPPQFANKEHFPDLIRKLQLAKTKADDASRQVGDLRGLLMNIMQEEGLSYHEVDGHKLKIVQSTRRQYNDKLVWELLKPEAIKEVASVNKGKMDKFLKQLTPETRLKLQASMTSEVKNPYLRID